MNARPTRSAIPTRRNALLTVVETGVRSLYTSTTPAFPPTWIGTYVSNSLAASPRSATFSGAARSVMSETTWPSNTDSSSSPTGKRRPTSARSSENRIVPSRRQIFTRTTG